ncbi:serine hydrolase [Micromonospora sp. NPDC002296]|uniref:serine hydrolase domain-containing protein n=1 Tax=Micromonospora sp. NPDC002296 TaxID=3154271 RepID=UPI00332D7A4F
MQESETDERLGHESPRRHLPVESQPVDPGSPLLADMLALWRELLSQPELPVDADFFVSGGQSLLAIQLLQRVRRTLGIPVPLDTLISAPTPRRFAERLTVLRAEYRRDEPADRPASRSTTGGLDRAIAEAIGEVRHLGIQLYVSIAGKPVHDRVAGHREDGTPLGPDDALPWFSGGKPLLAAALCELWRRGSLDPNEPVATYLPAFGTDGKAAITLRHLLTHSSGRLLTDDPRSADPYSVGYTRAVQGALAARLHPDDVPGQQPSYLSSAIGWLVLSEVVRQLDGRDFDRFVTDEIAGPLGTTYHFGFSTDELRALGGQVGTYHRHRAAELSSPQEVETAANTRRLLASGLVHTTRHPGEGLWASARSMARFYELLCHHAVGDAWSAGHDGLLDAPTVQQMIRPQRPSFFGEAPLIDFGLGLTLESRRHGEEHAYYGSHTSPRTFGHQGHGSSPMAYVDPEHELVVAFNGNGLPGFVAGRSIWHRVSDAIYRELGLASPTAR